MKKELIDFTYWIKNHDLSLLDNVEECVDLYLKSINSDANDERC